MSAQRLSICLSDHCSLYTKYDTHLKTNSMHLFSPNQKVYQNFNKMNILWEGLIFVG